MLFFSNSCQEGKPVLKLRCASQFEAEDWKQAIETEAKHRQEPVYEEVSSPAKVTCFQCLTLLGVLSHSYFACFKPSINQPSPYLPHSLFSVLYLVRTTLKYNLCACASRLTIFIVFVRG